MPTVETVACTARYCRYLLSQKSDYRSKTKVQRGQDLRSITLFIHAYLFSRKFLIAIRRRNWKATRKLVARWCQIKHCDGWGTMKCEYMRHLVELCSFALFVTISLQVCLFFSSFKRAALGTEMSNLESSFRVYQPRAGMANVGKSFTGFTFFRAPLFRLLERAEKWYLHLTVSETDIFSARNP